MLGTFFESKSDAVQLFLNRVVLLVAVVISLAEAGGPGFCGCAPVALCVAACPPRSVGQQHTQEVSDKPRTMLLTPSGLITPHPPIKLQQPSGPKQTHRTAQVVAMCCR